MANYILKIGKYYLEWSTEIGAPVTPGMSLREFKKYYQRKFGFLSMAGLERRLERVEHKGTSSMLADSAEETVSINFAGPPKFRKNGSLKRYRKLTLGEIYQVYCLQEPLNGWLPDWFNQEEPSALSSEHEFLMEISLMLAQLSPPETEEEINQSLLDAGYDPDEIAEHFRNLAKRILGEDAE